MQAEFGPTVGEQQAVREIALAVIRSQPLEADGDSLRMAAFDGDKNVRFLRATAGWNGDGDAPRGDFSRNEFKELSRLRHDLLSKGKAKTQANSTNFFSKTSYHICSTTRLFDSLQHSA